MEPVSPCVSLLAFLVVLHGSVIPKSEHIWKIPVKQWPRRGKEEAPFTPDSLLVAPPFPAPSGLCDHLPVSLCWGQKSRSRHAPHPFWGKGSRESRMNLSSEKHGVQTGGFLLSCFTSVKASINSTLIIKSEQCVFGFQQLNSVTAASLGSLASSTS